MKKARRSVPAFLLMMLAGAVIGSALWSFLSPYLPGVLTQSFQIGSTGGPWKLDLVFIVLTFGAVLSLNIGSLIGIIVAIVVFYNL